MLSLVASHHDLDLSVLERLSADTHAVGREIVTASESIAGAVVLATCNRFELYLDVADADAADAARRAVAGAVAARSGYTPERVADSLAPARESMVVGEREIAGQVRRALTAARRDGTTTSDLEGLFQAASRTSRAVEGRTGLADWSDVRCLLIGTGSYAGASLAALKARGCQDVLVYSASGRAGQFAAQRGVTAATDDLAASLSGVDLVVACSGASGAVLDVDALIRARSAEAALGARPLAVLDLALQHDVDPAVGELPGVRLVSLTTVAEQAPDGHSATVAEARALVEEQAATFERDLRTRQWNPPVLAERRRVHEDLAAAVEGLDEREARSLRRRVRAALHAPTVRAREAAAAGDAAAYAAALADLAAVEVPRPALAPR